MRERIGLDLELHDAGENLRDLNNIASPVQGLRDVFDIMATDSVEDWENIASRLNGLPGAVDGYVESLTEAASRGDVAAIRQVRECVDQARELAGSDSFFTSFTRGPAVDGIPDVLLALYERLREQKGIGAALLRARQCGGCNMTLDASELSRIRSAPVDEVVRCEECQRILVRTDESGL